jgi:hypothetical protein
MNDLNSRVVRLCYRVETVGEEDYDPKVTAVGTLGSFSYWIQARIATLDPMTTLATEAAAHEVVDPLIAGWNVHALLSLGPGAFQLRHLHTLVSGEGTPAPCDHAARADAAKTDALLIHTQYPAAPHDMIADGDVLALAEEYARLLREPNRLVAAGQAAVALLERRFAERKAAAEALHVDLRVLHKLAEITSPWGRRTGAEKITTWKSTRRVTKAEREWIVDVTRALTRRLAQHAAGVRPAERMSRLP